MEITKPNDIFAISTMAPDVNAYDLLHSEMTPDNTSFLDKETYKNTDLAKKAFTGEDGKFNDLAFTQAYNNAANLYAEISNDKYLRNSLEWDAYDYMRPIHTKTRLNTAEIVQDINPYENLYGRTSLNSIDPGKLSKRELAQKSEVFDMSSGKFLGKSANDLGLLGAWFNDTLIYAQWDEDGEHTDPITKRVVKHFKGEDKLNASGHFYTETLAGRDVANRQVVNPTDLITNDESSFNKVDFFDSDGREKSIAGTTFKLGVELAPFLIPGFNTYYGGFKAATGLASVFPTFYKAMEGIILGDSTVGNETDLWKAATAAEGFAARFNQDSYSDEGSKSMFKYEQLGSMVTSIFSQVYEQRAAASLSKMFYKVNNPEYADKLTDLAKSELTKGVLGGVITEKNASQVAAAAMTKIPEIAKLGIKQSNLAKSLSLGYMALTSTGTIYQDALNGGYDRRTAGVAALLAAGGQYSIMMNNRMGDWFLDKSVGYNLETNNASIRKTINKLLPDIEPAVKMMDVNKVAGKQALVGAISKAKNAIKNILVNPIVDSTVGEQIYKNAIVEGIEEVTEQMILDATKGVVDTMSWLGFTGKKGSFNTVDEVFSKKGLQTYLSNLLGGIVGGGLFEIHRLRIEPFISGQAIEPETEFSLIRQVANGKTHELKSEIDRRISSMGNDTLAPLQTDSDGTPIYLVDENMSQAKVVGEAAKKYIDHLDGILNSENLKLDDESVIKKAILDKIREIDLEKSQVHKFILSDFNENTKKIIDLRSAISQLDPEKDKEKISELTSQLKAKRDEVQDFLNGKNASYYKQLSLFSLNNKLHGAFTSLNVADYTTQTYGKNFYELPKEGGTLSQQKINQEYKDIMDSPSNKKDKMKFMFSIFDTANKKYSNLIGDYAEETHIISRERYNQLLTNSKLLTPDELASLQGAGQKAGLTSYDLSDIIKMPLGQLLHDNGYLDVKGYSEEEIQGQINFLNKLQIPFKDLNQKFLHNIVSSLAAQETQELTQKKMEELAVPGADVIAINTKYAEQFKNLGRLTPRLNVPSSTEILPLDALYLSNELKNDKFITTEIQDLVEKRSIKIFEALKEKSKIVSGLTSGKGLITSLNQDKEVDIETLVPFLNTIAVMFQGLNAKLLATTTVEETNKVIDEIQKYGTTLEKAYADFSKTIFSKEDYTEFGIDEDAKIFQTNVLELLDTVVPIKSTLLEQTNKILQKPVMNNKLLDIISNISIDIYSEKDIQKVNILEILQGELEKFRLLEKSQDYVRTRDVINNMKQAISTISLVKSINAAMLDSSIDAMNPYGFNVSMREGLSKVEDGKDIESYKIINSQAYTLLNKELDKITHKLNFLIELSETNQGTVIANQEAIRENSIKLFTNSLIDRDSKTSAVNITIGGTPLLDEGLVTTIMSSQKSTEEKLFDIEEAIFINFNKLAGNNVDAALKEMSLNFSDKDFLNSIIKSTEPGLTKDLKVLDNKDYFTYLHSIVAVNTKNFYNKYKNILQNELSLEDKKSPFFIQEFSIRLGYAYLKNKTVMSHVMSFLKEHLHDPNSPIKDNKSILENIFILTGSGGVGKTTVISNFLLRMLQGEDIDFIASAPNDRVLNKLKKDISRGITKEIKIYNNTDLLKKLIGDGAYKSFNDANKELLDKAIAQEKGENIDNIKIPSEKSVFDIKRYNDYDINLTEEFKQVLNNNLPKETIIFADEISWFNPLELQVINYLASKGKVYFIGLGDDLQDGYNLSESSPYSLETFYYNSAPKIKGVVRGNNIHKKDNNENLEIGVKNLLAKINGEPFNPEGSVVTYYNGATLQGDKFTQELSIDDLKRFNPLLETVIITDSGKPDTILEGQLKEAGISSYRFIAKNNIQGEEFDQVVALFKIPFKEGNDISLYNSYKKLYTLLSRAKNASLIVGNNDLLEALNIKNDGKNTTSKVEFDQSQIETSLNNRYEYLQNIFKEYSESKYETKEDSKVTELQEEAQLYSLEDNPSPEVDVESNIKGMEDSFKKEKDGDNKFFVYSFYNALHAYYDGDILEIQSTEGKIPSDIQTMNLLFEDRPDKMIELLEESPKNVINNFIQVKNALLHKISGFSNFNSNITSDNDFQLLINNYPNEVVIRKLIYDDKFISTYGKQAHLNGKKPTIGKEYLFIAYKGNLNAVGTKPFYVTLGALPDVNNPNWSQNNNKEYLKNIFESLEVGESMSIDNNINPYSGIRFIYEDGTSKKPTGKSKISITGNTFDEFVKALQEMSPGIKILDVDKIRVFGKDTEVIKSTLANTGYRFNGKEVTVSNLDSFRFRPYIKVSYLDPSNNEVSRIIALSPKSRGLGDAKQEYEKLQEEFRLLSTEDKTLFARTKFPILINKWAGAQLFRDIVLNGNINVDDLKNRIKAAEAKYTSVEKAGYEKVYEKLETIFGIISKKELKDLSTEERSIVLGTIKGQTRVGNLGLRLLEVLTEDEISELGDNKIIYYNATFDPSNTESGERFMDKDFIKYFEVSSYLEPPMFMLDLNTIKKKIAEVETTKELEIQEEKAQEDFLGQNIILEPTTIVNITIGNKMEPFSLDLSNWDTKTLEGRKNILLALNTLYTSFQNVQIKINSIPSQELEFNDRQNLVNFNKEVMRVVMENPSFLQDGDINTSLITNVIEYARDNMSINDVILSQAVDKFLTGRTNKIDNYIGFTLMSTKALPINETKLIQQNCK